MHKLKSELYQYKCHVGPGLHRVRNPYSTRFEIYSEFSVLNLIKVIAFLYFYSLLIKTSSFSFGLQSRSGCWIILCDSAGVHIIWGIIPDMHAFVLDSTCERQSLERRGKLLYMYCSRTSTRYHVYGVSGVGMIRVSMIPHLKNCGDPSSLLMLTTSSALICWTEWYFQSLGLKSRLTL